MYTTVVIPNYNGIKYIRQCLESLYACKPKDFEIVVVDDCSTDDSVSYLESQRDRITFIRNENNLGFAATVNRGIRHAVTDTVILLNNDTVVEEDFVINLCKAMESDLRVFSVSARMIDMNNKEVLDGAGDYYCSLGWAFARGKGKRVKDYCLKRKSVFSACGGAAIYRRAVFEKIGLFDEAHFAYLEDVDVGYRAKINGYINIYEPSAVVYHAGSGVSGSRYNEFKVKLSSRNSTYIIGKNMPILQVVINLPLLLLGFMIKTLFFAKKGYGRSYVKGLALGIKMACGKSGREKHVRFRMCNLCNYCTIQIELWLNCIRRFFVNY